MCRRIVIKFACGHVYRAYGCFYRCESEDRGTPNHVVRDYEHCTRAICRPCQRQEMLEWEQTIAVSEDELWYSVIGNAREGCGFCAESSSSYCKEHRRREDDKEFILNTDRELSKDWQWLRKTDYKELEARIASYQQRRSDDPSTF